MIETANTTSTTAVSQLMSSDAFWGIVGSLSGTILGAILGWLFSKLSDRGKISIYLRAWEESFIAPDRLGGLSEQKKAADAQTYRYSATVEIYNSSRNPNIIRDVHIVFRANKATLFSTVPDDDSTGRQSGPVRFYDEIGAYNIPGNGVVTIKLHGAFSKNNNDLMFLRSADGIWIEYKDGKNKTKRSRLKPANYASYFTSVQEES